MLKTAARSLLDETSRYRILSLLRAIRGSSHPQRMPSDPASIGFTCNICGAACTISRAVVLSDGQSCDNCGASSRFRAVIHGLSIGLYGKSLPLAEFPKDKRIRGAGMTDWVGYASRLAGKFDYTNTYYHKEPFLDITARSPLSPNQYDFVLSSDVLEHVRPPVSTALRNVLTILKPGGFFVVTVPCSAEAVTREHFPQLYEYEVVKFHDRFLLLNRTQEGDYQVFDNLVFHGGPGAALELRCFSRTGLVEEMRAAGFEEVRILDEAPAIGVLHSDPPMGVLIIGRKKAN